MEEVKNLLKWYQQMGVDEIIADNIEQLDNPTRANNLQEESMEFEYGTDLISKARAAADKCNNLEELRFALENFDGLSIKKTATNLVFADGNPKADVMAIGEAPGANEDEEAIPFCGVSGRLLDKVLASIDLSREKNLYITNSIFWRPPGNRKPTSEESEVCLPFVEKHIALIKPKIILLVGSTSAAALLKSTETISRLRSKFYEYNNDYLEKPIPVAVIFHPSYLLRQPLQKKTVWFDLLRMQKSFLE